jgi:hypothetical protein
MAEAALEAGRPTANPTGLCPNEAAMQPYVKVTESIEEPSDELLFNRKFINNIPILRCPVCGDEFSHVVAVYTLLGSDESEGLYRGSHLVARETPYRRDAIAVRVNGETCGHSWDVVFQQQKGNTFVRVDVLESRTATNRSY